MGYMPTTRSGHNMFTMSSLLQKSIRRGDSERAGYAANELLSSYEGVLWKRLLVVSAEDCWGVITKEITNLHNLHSDYVLNYGEKPTKFVSKAVELLCNAKKSRDACYFACNFMLSENKVGEEYFNCYDVQNLKFTLNSNEFQLDFESKGILNQNDVDSYLLIRSMMNFDMIKTGYYARELMKNDEQLLWKTLLFCSSYFTNNKLNDEISACKSANSFVNKRKKFEEKDPIFIAKSIMNLMYNACNKFDSILSSSEVEFDKNVELDTDESFDISQCKLENNYIPEYVFDVHTIQGKRNGKTDWEMNLVEDAALNPKQPAFFEKGSWEIRYDYKHQHQMCTDGEYRASLEYRKNHVADPSKDFLSLYGTKK